jgi:hypothetical protein
LLWCKRCYSRNTDLTVVDYNIASLDHPENKYRNNLPLILAKLTIVQTNKKIVLQCWVIVYPFIIVGLTYRPLSAEYMFVQLLVLLRLMGDCFCIYSQDDLNLQCYSQRLSSLCFCCIDRQKVPSTIRTTTFT